MSWLSKLFLSKEAIELGEIAKKHNIEYYSNVSSSGWMIGWRYKK